MSETQPEARCPTCHHRFVDMDADEVEVLGLPETMCKCMVERHVERLRGEGWVPASIATTATRVKLGIPCTQNVAGYATPRVGKGQPRPSVVEFGPYIPEWAAFLLLMNEQCANNLAPLVARVKADPALAAVLVTVGRTGGVAAVQDYVFAGLHARNVGHDARDLPEDVLTRDEARDRFWGRS